MSVAEDISSDLFLVIVFQGVTEKEPTVVPQSWLCDDNKAVMWPPSIATYNTVYKKIKPKENWTKYEVLDVYWKTGWLNGFGNYTRW